MTNRSNGKRNPPLATNFCNSSKDFGGLAGDGRTGGRSWSGETEEPCRLRSRAEERTKLYARFICDKPTSRAERERETAAAARGRRNLCSHFLRCHMGKMCNPAKRKGESKPGGKRLAASSIYPSGVELQAGRARGQDFGGVGDGSTHIFFIGISEAAASNGGEERMTVRAQISAF